MLTQSLWKTVLVHRKAKSNKQKVFELTSFNCTISSTIWTCSFTSFQPFIDTICMIFMTTWQRFCIFTTHFIPTNATLTVLLAYFQQMFFSLFKFLFVFIVQVFKFFVVSLVKVWILFWQFINIFSLLFKYKFQVSPIFCVFINEIWL